MAAPARQMRFDNPSGGGFDIRHMRLWPVTFWLILINIAVFVGQLISADRITEWGIFSVATAIHGLQLWRFITFQFLHADIWHLAFNMLALYYFGTFLEGRL